MSRQTFSKKLRGLISKGLIKKERIIGQRGNPTLYRLNSKHCAGLTEVKELTHPGYIKNEIERFENDIVSFETKIYIEAMMQLAINLLYILPIFIIFDRMGGARWMFYNENYENIEQIFRYILNRASRSKEDQKQTLNKLFELVGPFYDGSIGKRFGLNEIYNAKDKIIKIIANEA